MTQNEEGGICEVSRLKNFPNSFLAICLGLIGFTLAWQRAETILILPFTISNYLLYISVMVMGIVLATYTLKIVKYPDEVRKEFNHPVKLNFYPILAKLFLITSIIYLSIDFLVAKYLWWGGVVIQFVFTLIIMSAWMKHKYEIHHINPSWFIPVVGSIIVPIAGVEIYSESLSWFFFSIGFFWWLILTVLVMNRVIFHHPIPDKLIPTFFILFAPPVIGFISITKLMGSLNPFGYIMYYFGLFMFILLMYQFRMFLKIHFYLSWWAYSFPMDALVIGTLLMYHEAGGVFFRNLSWILFIMLNLIILLLTYKTATAIKYQKICIEEIE
ncbi:MAG: SLAC1 anion channel family protein [Methanosarcinaceae archaeon]|nr:SLAC1 anion channel family protein [Methanosarcinaceae archaeon]